MRARRFLPAVLASILALLVLGAGRAASPDPSIRPSSAESTRDAFRFRFETPDLRVEPDPEGGFAIRMSGFATPERRPGAPDIPVRIVRVAIPPDAVPRLEVESVREEVRRGIRPRPVAEAIVDLFEEGRRAASGGELATPVERRWLRKEDPAHFDSLPGDASPIARLGEIGELRDQRYVEVVLAPVRFDPRAGGLRVATSFEVRVEFGTEGSSPTAPRIDPRFESVYRDAFVNYAQGTTFRRSSDPFGASATPEGGGEGSLSNGPHHRIRVRQNGVVRLDHGRVSGTGFVSQPLSTWRLRNRGFEVPLAVRDVNGNDLIDPGDWVQFYGQALDGEPKAVLHTDIPGTPADLFEARDFTDENVYFLEVESGARSRHAAVDAAPTMIRVPPNDFEGVSKVEVDNAWRPLGGADPWYWVPTMSNPAQSGLVPVRSPDEVVALTGLASGSAPVRVLVNLRGLTEDSATSGDHKSRVTLKNGSGATLTTNDDNGTFDGRTLYLHDFTFPGPGVTDPVLVGIQALSVAGSPGYFNQLILDWIEVRYRRLFQASGDRLTFDYPDGDAEFVVSGLTSATPEIWEITGRVSTSEVVRPVRLTSGTVSGAGPFSVRFRVDNDPALADGVDLRRFVVFGGGGVSIPANPDFEADTVSDLRQNSNQADLIVIAHPTVLGTSATISLNQLLAHHAGNGITSKIAMLRDVEDEFGGGLSGPLAIREFLRWVMSTAPGEGWADPKPSYVLLLGDASYDFKGGTAQGNFVPTQIMFRDDPSIGYYASDNLLGTALGSDSLPDVVLGRISARTDAEANTVLQKILAYAQGAPSGNWRRHAVLIADRGKRDGTGSIDLGEVENFEGINDTSVAYMKRPPHTARKLYYYTTYCTKTPPEICDPNGIRADIRAAVNGTDGISDGAAIVQTASHGNFDIWSDDAFWDDRPINPTPDTSTLTNGGRLPWLVVHNCLTGGFHTTTATSLGENWLKRSGGGAVAVFAPSNLSFTYLGFTVAGSIWKDVYGPPKERALAIPVMNALSTLCGQNSTEACQGLVLLGDPATTLAIPSVGPAQNVIATGGNTRVDLAWSASATPGATYDVYRTEDLVRDPMVKINPAPVTGLTYADTGLTNARTYYYAVVALDAEEFESRWSHFNSDCDVSGPDCLKAIPLNPNPPAVPTGLVVTDPESGGRLNLNWTANGESDLLRYDVHYGTAPGVYTSIRNAGKTTSYALTGLTNGTTYYIAITATNTSSQTSGFSTEESGKPTWVRGVRSPAFIGDLRLAKSGSDIRLDWTAVTTDLYGKPETVARYEVYRGTTPSFVPSLANRIGTPTSNTFLDVGALSGGGPRYHYLVRAVDTDGVGNPGGLGNQLPNGIGGLTIAKSGTTPGNLVLTWPAVTTDFDGNPLAIDHYDLYALDRPFTRAEIREGIVQKLVPPSPVVGTSIEITPPAGSRYYSVLAVDARGNVSPF